ncbi:hypothetical protein AB0L50_25665 [Streptomyces flaveolus]
MQADGGLEDLLPPLPHGTQPQPVIEDNILTGRYQGRQPLADFGE